MKEILEKEYNKYYEEYKNYDRLATDIAKKVKTDREDFKTFANGNQDNFELLEDKLFEINEKQILHLQDLATLKARLRIATNLLEEVIEIPKEILAEVNKFPDVEFLFKITNDEFEEIDSEKVNKIKSAWKEMYKQQIETIAKND